MMNFWILHLFRDISLRICICEFVLFECIWELSLAERSQTTAPRRKIHKGSQFGNP
jgi:hypothetical protein